MLTWSSKVSEESNGIPRFHTILTYWNYVPSVEGGNNVSATSSEHCPFLSSIRSVLPGFSLSQLLFIQELISGKHSVVSVVAMVASVENEIYN